MPSTIVHRHLSVKAILNDSASFSLSTPFRADVHRTVDKEGGINRRTSIDFPQSCYDYITKQIVNGKEKSMRSMLLKLLSYHRHYDIGSWRPDDGVLQSHMVRWVMMSDADMQAFEEHLTPEARYEVGLTIGKMWAEAWTARAQT